MEPDQIPPKPPGVSDEMWQQMLQFMFQQGPPQSPNAPFLSEDDTSYVNSRLTQEGKANDYISDPASRARLGVNGYGPEQFQPTVSYQPVKAPAYQKLMQMQGSNDAASQIIAEVFLSGGTGLDAENRLMAAMTDPSSPDYAELQPGRSPVLWEATDTRLGYGKPIPNTSRIQKITSDLDTLALNDPVFNAINPDTGLPANVVDEEGNVVHEQDDGSWASRIETPTEAMRYFDDMGLSSPYEPYDQILFASPEVQEREAGVRDEQQRAMTQYMLTKEKSDADLGGSLLNEVGSTIFGTRDYANDDTLMDRIRELAKEEGPQELNLQGSITGGLTPSAVGRGRRSEVPSSSSFDAPRSRSAPARNRNVRGRDDFERQARQERGGRKMDTFAARRVSNNANHEAVYAQIAAQKRAAMARMVAQQGYTPFNEQMGYMNQSVYG